jgi:outer membrane protein TolC
MIAATLGAVLLLPVRAQAPSTPERPWPIPDERAREAQVRPNPQPVETTKRYDLAGLIDLAERTNPETQEAWEQARQAAAAVGLVESSYLPQLSFQAIGGFEHTPLPAPKDLVPAGYFVSDTREVIPTIALKWLLFDFGRRHALVQAARADSFVANVAFTAAHQKLVYNVTKAYFDLGAARGRLRAAQKAVSTATTTRDATTAKRSNGLATVVAVAQADRQLAQSKYNLTAAVGAERNAHAALITTIGLEAGTELAIADSSELPMPESPRQSIAEAVHEALTRQPQIIASLGQIDAAEASLKSEQRSYYPTLEVAGKGFQNIGALSSDGKPYSTIDRPGGSILLSLSVPIFDGGLRANRVSIAKSKLREAEDKLSAARDATTQQVVKAYNSLVTSISEREAALALSQAAHAAYDAALHAYQRGVGTYTDLATEENAVVEAETQMEDAQSNAHTGAAALVFAIGAADTPPN